MFKRIAVDASHDENYKRRLTAATQLARQHDAEVVGVYTGLFERRNAYDEVVMPERYLAMRKEAMKKHEEEAQAIFWDVLEAAGIHGKWRTPHGGAVEALSIHARFCDLLVMSQNGFDQPVGSLFPDLAESAILSAGRPVLMVPNRGNLNGPIGQRVLFCWDYGRRSARAFKDAAPVLKKSTHLFVLTVDPNPDLLKYRDLAPDDFSSYCALHNYPKIQELRAQSANLDVGNTILNAAADHSCDLAIMGAYSHSRVREWMLGGASRSLLEAMTVPILFSH
jgi:nucleotide-binding universal stress UspA family protein